MAKDYYDLLGVSRSATEDEIKKAFRKKAHEFHPDKTHGDETKFKEVNEAYQVLSNKEKRGQYDQYGQTFDDARRQGGGPGAGAGFGGFGQQGGFQGNVDMGDLGDIFGDMFGFGGGRSRRTRKQSGADIQADLRLTFREAVFGVTKEFSLYKEAVCNVCDGSGAEPGTKVTTCSTCKGSGQVQRVVNSIFGQMAQAVVCSTCDGQGSIPSQKCKTCGGDGKRKQDVLIKVNVPAGIDDGETLRLSGQGEAGERGAGAGDLFLRIQVQTDPRYKRTGADIISDAHLGLASAALGTKVEVETLDGPVSMKIPAGTQSGKVFRLADKGVPHLRKRGRGDHLVTIIVDTPRKISGERKKLLKKLAELEGEEVDS
ncbi:MAG: molecular chaperone DnaJ [Patescibacteria group bacterium]